MSGASGSLPADLTLATVEAGEPTVTPPWVSLWYRFTAPLSGVLRLSLATSDGEVLRDTLGDHIRFYAYVDRAGTLAGLTPVFQARRVDSPNNPTEVAIVSGQRYAIQVAAQENFPRFDSDPAILSRNTLRWSTDGACVDAMLRVVTAVSDSRSDVTADSDECGAAGPANDNFTARATISGASGSRSVSATQHATVEAGEPIYFPRTRRYDAPLIDRTVWFKLVAPSAGAAVFTLSSGAGVSVYSDRGALSTLVLLGKAVGVGSSVSVAVAAGAVLAIQVHAKEPSEGEPEDDSAVTLTWRIGGAALAASWAWGSYESCTSH